MIVSEPFSGTTSTPTATWSQPDIRVFAEPEARRPEVRVSPQEIEVTMEPIVVGIEMGPEITISGSGARSVGGANIPDNYIQVSHRFFGRSLKRSWVRIPLDPWLLSSSFYLLSRVEFPYSGP